MTSTGLRTCFYETNSDDVIDFSSKGVRSFTPRLKSGRSARQLIVGIPIEGQSLIIKIKQDSFCGIYPDGITKFINRPMTKSGAAHML